MDDNSRFLYIYFYRELPSLESLLQDTEYRNIFDKFMNSCQMYANDLKNASGSNKIVDENASPDIQPDKKLKNKNLEKLVEKWRTPMASRTNFSVTVPKVALPAAEQKNETACNTSDATDGSTRKRSAYAADISITVESDEENKEECEISEVKVKLFKADKKTNKANSEEMAEETDEKETTEQTESGKNPSKKMKLSDQPSETPHTTKKSKKSKKNTSVQEANENNEEGTSAKSTKKVKGTKKKKGTKSKKAAAASVAGAEDGKEVVKIDEQEPTTEVSEEPPATVVKKIKKTKKTKSSKTKEIADPESGAVDAKTPVRNEMKMKLFAKTPNTNNRRMSRVLLQSAIRMSTAKARRPNTRRAAAEAAKNADKVDKANKDMATSAQVKTGEVSAPTALSKFKAKENEALVLSGKKPLNPTVSALKKTASGLSVGSPVKKLIGKFENINSTPGSIKRKLVPSNLQDSISRIKSKNPIDERKIRTSQAKLDAKRKSVKKAQHFLQQNMSKRNTNSYCSNSDQNVSSSDKESTDKEVSHKDNSKEKGSLSDKSNSSNKKSSTSSKNSTEKQAIVEVNEYKDEPVEIMDETVNLTEPTTTTTIQVASKSVESTKPTILISKISMSPTLSETPKRLSIYCYSQKEQAAVDKMINTSPKVRLSRIPVNLVSGNQRVSSSSATAFLEAQQRRLTKDFAQGGPPKVTTSYNPLAKMTPSKPSNYVLNTVANLQNTAVKAQSKFGSFFDRNTPQKMSLREAEEKRKAELHLKEAKEKERLAEQERMKQEKRDESKKKREEKLKKIQEVKQKKEMELEQKRKEMEKERQQLTVPKITSSSTNNSFLQKSYMNNTQNHGLKKPFSSSTMNQQPATKKLSTVDQEAISEFALKMGKMKMLQTLGTDDDDIPLTKTTNKGIESNTGYQMTKNNNLETTYVLQSPPPMHLKPITNKPDLMLKANTLQSYNVTPLQAPKLKDINNYDVSQLGSEDDTDDDEDPSKPIPEWAMTANLVAKVKAQNHMMLNFTRMFRAASKSEIILEEIFKTRRKKFTERSSSANWTCPPVWDSHGITGEESFMVFRRDNH